MRLSLKQSPIEVELVWSIIYSIQIYACGWFGCVNWESRMLWTLLINNIDELDAPINIFRWIG